MSFQDVGAGFVQHYYTFFSAQRNQLAGIYRPSTLLTWQTEQVQGVDAIMARFASLGFAEAAFKQDNIDCQPSMSGGVIVVVNGEVKLKDEQHSLKFNDVFHLALENGQWYVSNQIFNIVGGGQ
ncbi:hypothetical protein GH5_06955 [Leishmania sp. Ghana 2012 LV757]|uniref:Nuclear transport factor 2 n=1 Tax=Leishmania orientalis TaxID=2249476 RepID=A0A836HQH3_9TRYP|nr:hypothetical protein LSCM4_06631 [Leishmania orientalis]KAG5510731.1 hypothetical protein GH5_06955 [Leishmania sp. Ghana 2012 LV757]